MNRFEFLGRLAADPILTVTEKGKKVCNFILAVDTPAKGKGKKRSDFFAIESWNNMADVCQKYLVKGTKILVTGFVANNTYKRDDVLVRSMRFVLVNFEFCESKAAQSNTGVIMGEVTPEGEINEHGNKNPEPIEFDFSLPEFPSDNADIDFGEIPFV